MKCHCGDLADAVARGYEGPAGRGSCLHCALVRCDAFPGACRDNERLWFCSLCERRPANPSTGLCGECFERQQSVDDGHFCDKCRAILDQWGPTGVGE